MRKNFLLTTLRGHGTLTAMISATDFLLQSQNADGGWGYRVNAMSYVEPTSAVMLALRESNARARDFLLAHQLVDGGWGIAPMDKESGWMTAWAVRALSALSERESVARGVRWLIGNEGVRYTDQTARATVNEISRIDASLRGWSWQPGDAAWVHPTALAMLALGEAEERTHARVREGVAYLFDRAVPSGGWNVGNPWMLGKIVPATIQDTAIALLALRAAREPADAAPIANAIRFLREALSRMKTSAELAWAIYALREWKVDVGDAPARLGALQNADGSWQGNPFITAIAMRVTSDG
ncbi:hypothetical protein ANRL1_02755 [Anaerolineae bacterium]|nr:hypothetical protein ANRL1_02755 [Anaerolineae bacterium]